MHRCLKLLKSISQKELTSWLNGKPGNELPGKVDLFLYYMRVEFLLISPIGLDPIKLSENLIENIYFTNKNHLPLTRDMLAKIDTISRIIDAKKSHICLTYGDDSIEYQKQRENETAISELYSSIDTIIPARDTDIDKENHDEENRNLIINFHVKNILSALNHNKLHLAIKSFMDFGNFLSKNYPNYSLEKIRESLYSIKLFKNEELPPLEIFCALFEARICLTTKLASNPSKHIIDIGALNGFKNSLNVFGFLMGENRLEKKLHPCDQHEINNAKNTIECHLPSQKKIRSNLQIMNKSISKVIFSLTKKLRHLDSKLLKNANSNSKSILTHEAIKIDQRRSVINDAIDNTNDQPISNNVTFSSFSQDLQDLINSNRLITAVHLDEIKMQFEHLIENKIILPLKKYNEERGFLSQFKRWASDTIKKAFGVGNLSTYATLFEISKEKSELFDLGISLSKLQLKK